MTTPIHDELARLRDAAYKLGVAEGRKQEQERWLTILIFARDMSDIRKAIERLRNE